jgi:hypothetical protein
LLTEAVLRKANLSGCDLYRAHLEAAVLAEADLSGAGLVKAVLDEATLTGANLDGADLGSAELWGVDASGASLRGSRLHGAALLETKLYGADLSHATVQETSCRAASSACQRLRRVSTAGRPSARGTDRIRRERTDHRSSLTVDRGEHAPRVLARHLGRQPTTDITLASAVA